MLSQTILIIESIFILICIIPLLFRLKNWLYKKQNLENKKYEEYIFLIGSFTVLLLLGIFFKNLFLLLLSLPFIFWLLVDAIEFDIKLWKIFLNRTMR